MTGSVTTLRVASRAVSGLRAFVAAHGRGGGGCRRWRDGGTPVLRGRMAVSYTHLRVRPRAPRRPAAWPGCRPSRPTRAPRWLSLIHILPALLGKGTEAGERINSVTVFPGKEAGEGTLPALTGERTGTGDGTAPALTGERTGTGDNTLPALPGERTGSGDGTGQSRLTAGLANAPGDKAEQDGKGRGRKRRDKACLLYTSIQDDLQGQ